MSPERRDALLAAIAKARGWIEGIRLGRFASFVEIAEHEAQGERHIRVLAPLALLSPRIIAANQSLSAVEPVSAPPKRKLEKRQQGPAPETRPAPDRNTENRRPEAGAPSLMSRPPTAVDCLPRPDQRWLEAPEMTHSPVSLRSS
jgi:hypothetical protein